MTASRWVKCTICGHRLVRHGNTYRHGALSPDVTPHPPLPAPEADAGPARELCDFCAAPDPTWVCPAESFVLIDGSRSVGDWLACADCAKLVSAGDPAPLAEHAAVRFIARTTCSHASGLEPPAVVVALLAQRLLPAYRDLMAHRTGPVARR